MKYIDILYTVADNAGVPTTQIGQKLGMSREYVATMKSKQNIPRIDTAAKLLGVCDYVLCALPSDRVPSDALVVSDGIE